jgi:release factor glutamine methyltransferase
MSGMPTIEALLTRGARQLSGSSESPRLDAELLLGKLLGRSRAGLMAHREAGVDAAAERALDALIEARRAGAPVAYLTGSREFWSLNLEVSPAVLVPRPETELLVELALRHLPAGTAAQILDLGTGSGAIALAIASERREASVVGVDLSVAALEVARGNADLLGLRNLDWRCGSWFEPVAGLRFDLALANPPYVAAGDPALARLAAEPRLALTPGPTGLEAFAAIIGAAGAHLRGGGSLILEHGSTQAGAVAALLERHGFEAVSTHADAAGLPRVTQGRTPRSHPFFINHGKQP